MLRFSLRFARNRSARSCTACSARAGSVRVSEAIVFMLLNRKCGRMRACKRVHARRGLHLDIAPPLVRHVEVAQRQRRDDQADRHVPRHRMPQPSAREQRRRCPSRGSTSCARAQRCRPRRVQIERRRPWRERRPSRAPPSCGAAPVPPNTTPPRRRVRSTAETARSGPDRSRTRHCSAGRARAPAR